MRSHKSFQHFGILKVPLISSTYIPPAIHQYMRQHGSKGVCPSGKKKVCGFKTLTFRDRHKEKTWGEYRVIFQCWLSPTCLKSSHWTKRDAQKFLFPPSVSVIFISPALLSFWHESLASCLATHTLIWTYTYSTTQVWAVKYPVTLSLASLSWSSSSEKLKPATVMKSPITATNLSPRSLVLLCW